MKRTLQFAAPAAASIFSTGASRAAEFTSRGNLQGAGTRQIGYRADPATLSPANRGIAMNKRIQLFCLFCFALILGCQSTTQAAHEGDRDPSFNGGQARQVSIPYNNTTDSSPVLIGFSRVSNGFLAAIRFGTLPSFTVRLVKVLENGTLAQNFGINGVRDLADAEVEWGAMTTLSGPDTIVVAGSRVVAASSGSTYSYHIVRLDAGGNVDSTFNANTGYNDVTPGYLGYGAYDYVQALYVLPSTGQILVAGSARLYEAPHVVSLMGLVRLNGNGTTDNSFGGLGQAMAEFPLNGGNDAMPYSLAVDSKYRILLGGYATIGTGATATINFAAVRFTSAGEVDSCSAQSMSYSCMYTYSFHLGGKFNNSLSDIRVDQTGKIYLIGTSSAATAADGNDQQKISILRLTDQFQVDTTYNPSLGHESFFMEGGVTGESDKPPSSLIDAKNRLMLASGSSSVNVARFVPSGAFDAYNNGSVSSGIVSALPSSSGSYLYGRPRLLLDGDRPVVAALTDDTSGSTFALKITRLLGDKIFINGFQ